MLFTIVYLVISFIVLAWNNCTRYKLVNDVNCLSNAFGFYYRLKRIYTTSRDMSSLLISRFYFFTLKANSMRSY